MIVLAAMLVLEPIFEADLPLELYAYRPGRNAQQAVVEVEELLFLRRPSGSCGRRPRGLLREHSPCRAFEVGSTPDRSIGACCNLMTRMMATDCPVEDTDDRGFRMTRTTEARETSGAAFRQGSPISPFAGEYLHAPVRAGMEDVRAPSEPSAHGS